MKAEDESAQCEPEMGGAMLFVGGLALAPIREEGRAQAVNRASLAIERNVGAVTARLLRTELGPSWALAQAMSFCSGRDACLLLSYVVVVWCCGLRRSVVCLGSKRTRMLSCARQERTFARLQMEQPHTNVELIDDCVLKSAQASLTLELLIGYVSCKWKIRPIVPI